MAPNLRRRLAGWPRFYPGDERILAGAGFAPRPQRVCWNLLPMSALRRLFCFLWLVVLPGARAAEPVVMPRFTHPGAGQTIYLLMPDRFANGRPDNDTG